MFKRRWAAYLMLAAGLFAVEFAAQRFVHVPSSVLVAGLMFSPLFEAAAIVIAARDGGFLTGNIYARLADRAWAVIVLEFLSTMLVAYSQSQLIDMSGAATFVGTLTLTFVALLVYAPVDAVLAQEHTALTIVPMSLGRSLQLSWRRISRAFGIFALFLFAQLVAELTALLFISKHVTDAQFWAYTPIGSLMTVAIAVIVTAAYVDLNRTKAT